MLVLLDMLLEHSLISPVLYYVTFIRLIFKVFNSFNICNFIFFVLYYCYYKILIVEILDKDWKASSRNVKDVLPIKCQYLSIKFNPILVQSKLVTSKNKKQVIIKSFITLHNKIKKSVFSINFVMR